jgi:hypothetical protein
VAISLALLAANERRSSHAREVLPHEAGLLASREATDSTIRHHDSLDDLAPKGENKRELLESGGLRFIPNVSGPAADRPIDRGIPVPICVGP